VHLLFFPQEKFFLSQKRKEMLYKKRNKREKEAALFFSNTNPHENCRSFWGRKKRGRENGGAHPSTSSSSAMEEAPTVKRGMCACVCALWPPGCSYITAPNIFHSQANHMGRSREKRKEEEEKKGAPNWIGVRRGGSADQVERRKVKRIKKKRPESCAEMKRNRLEKTRNVRRSWSLAVEKMRSGRSRFLLPSASARSRHYIYFLFFFFISFFLLPFFFFIYLKNVFFFFSFKENRENLLFLVEFRFASFFFFFFFLAVADDRPVPLHRVSFYLPFDSPIYKD
jgi:hypothetical protein